jgi:plasmid stabilization system protein ParE
MAVSFHLEAFNDLDEIREYLADSNPDAADGIVAEIFDAIHSLEAFPNQGFRRDNFTSRPLRFKIVREYVIAYAPAEQPLRVLAVFHGRRSTRVIAAILRGRD